MIKRVISSLLLVALSGSVLASANLEGYNPFKKPEPKESMVKKSDEYGASLDTAAELRARLLAEREQNNRFMPDPMRGAEMLQDNNRLLSQGYVYKGTMNGVDIYFHPETKRYKRDDSSVLKLESINTNLPPINQVNH